MGLDTQDKVDLGGLTPATLRLLRVLVVTLLVVMIGAGLTIIAVFWQTYTSATPPLPEAITLPPGVTASAITQGRDWYAVVTADDTILIFERATGRLQQTVPIEVAE